MTTPCPVLRKLQIDLITDTPNPIIEWFDILWDIIHVVEIDVYHKNGGEFIYYFPIGIQSSPVFFRDDNNNHFWCCNNNFWKILTDKYGVEVDHLYGITQFLLDTKYTKTTPGSYEFGILNHLDVLISLGEYVKSIYPH